MRSLLLILLSLTPALCDNLGPAVNGTAATDSAQVLCPVEGRRPILQTLSGFVVLWVLVLACHVHLHCNLFGNRNRWEIAARIVSSFLAPGFPIIEPLITSLYPKLRLSPEQKDNTLASQQHDLPLTRSIGIQVALAKRMGFHASTEKDKGSFPLAAWREQEAGYLSAQPRETSRFRLTLPFAALVLATVHCASAAIRSAHRIYRGSDVAFYADLRAFWMAASGIVICLQSLLALWVNLTFKIYSHDPDALKAATPPEQMDHQPHNPDLQSHISDVEKTKPSEERGSVAKSEDKDSTLDPTSNFDYYLYIIVHFLLVFAILALVISLVMLPSSFSKAMSTRMNFVREAGPLTQSDFGKSWAGMFTLFNYGFLTAAGTFGWPSGMAGTATIFMYATSVLGGTCANLWDFCFKLYDFRLCVAALAIAATLVLSRMLLVALGRANPFKARPQMDVVYFMAWLVIYEILLQAKSLFVAYTTPDGQPRPEDVACPQLQRDAVWVPTLF